MHHGVLLHMKGHMRHLPKSPPSNLKLQDFWFVFNPCPQTYSTLYRHSSNDCLDSGKFCLNFWRTVPVFQAKWPVSALEVHEIDLRLQHFFFVLLFLPHVHHRSERHQDIIDFWATALDAQVRDHVYGGSFAERSWFLKSTSCMSKDVVLGKNTCGHVPTNLDPLSYATKITSSLAFKQLVECVGIFCNCSEHLLAWMSFVLKPTTHVKKICTNCFRMSWTLSCQFQGAEETRTSNRRLTPILHQKWDMEIQGTPAPWLRTESIEIHTSTSLWVKLREFGFDHQIIVVKRRM